MHIYEEQFLFLLKSSLNNEKLPDGYHFDVGRVFWLAKLHNLFPVIYAKATESDQDVSAYKGAVLRLCASQISKNANFEKLYCALVDNDINVIVVKGPVCAACYTAPDYRLSSDFDIIVAQNDKNKLQEYFEDNGFINKNDTYTSSALGLYIEISTRLGEGSDKYGRMLDNALDGFFGRAIRCGVYNTLSHDEHLVYLVYHSFKHFIGSGFGLKQIADIYLYIKKYYSDINFENVRALIEKIGIKSFSDNVFDVISKVFDYNVTELTESSDEKILCFDDFMADLLDAGVFGKSSEDRLHSASVVQNTVKNNGEKTIIKTLFPSLVHMRVKYSILKYLPFLLPVFWIVRLIAYLFSSLGKKDATSPIKSLEIASERLELMKKMGII